MSAFCCCFIISLLTTRVGTPPAVSVSVPAEYGGLCTFCGAQVALSYNEQSQTNASPTPALQPQATPAQVPTPMQPPSSSSVQATSTTNQQDDLKEADAVAFKNRLVGYDRNAAQRTKVIDDQSDYFEIDSNTWLSKEVTCCKDCIHVSCNNDCVKLIAMAWPLGILQQSFAVPRGQGRAYYSLRLAGEVLRWQAIPSKQVVLKCVGAAVSKPKCWECFLRQPFG